VSTNADLIARARRSASVNSNPLDMEGYRQRGIRLSLADALEAAEKRATEAEAEVVRLHSQRASHA